MAMQAPSWYVVWHARGPDRTSSASASPRSTRIKIVKETPPTTARTLAWPHGKAAPDGGRSPPRRWPRRPWLQHAFEVFHGIHEHDLALCCPERAEIFFSRSKRTSSARYEKVSVRTANSSVSSPSSSAVTAGSLRTWSRPPAVRSALGGSRGRLRLTRGRLRPDDPPAQARSPPALCPVTPRMDCRPHLAAPLCLDPSSVCV